MYPTTGPGGEQIVIMSPRIGTPTPSLLQGSVPETGVASVDEVEEDDEFNLPVSLALFILFLYMFSGAWVFTVTDNWSFVDAIYFVFISISTIGFGDLIPQNEWSMICLSVYLLFGLALTSMCINVIQEQLAVAFEEAKLRLGTRMGIDVTEGSVCEDSDSKSVGGEGSRAGSRKDSLVDDPKKKKKKEENNNKTASGTSQTKQPEQNPFEIQKDQIGKSWKERRDLKNRNETSTSLNPLPTGSVRVDYTAVPMSVSSLANPPSSTASLDNLAPQRMPRKPRVNSKKNVNFDDESK